MAAYCALVVVSRSSWLTELVLSKVIFLCKFKSDARCICIQLLYIMHILYSKNFSKNFSSNLFISKNGIKIYSQS